MPDPLRAIGIRWPHDHHRRGNRRRYTRVMDGRSKTAVIGDRRGEAGVIPASKAWLDVPRIGNAPFAPGIDAKGERLIAAKVMAMAASEKACAKGRDTMNGDERGGIACQFPKH